jgi:hypothetical protein
MPRSPLSQNLRRWPPRLRRLMVQDHFTVASHTCSASPSGPSKRACAAESSDTRLLGSATSGTVRRTALVVVRGSLLLPSPGLGVTMCKRIGT